MKFIDRLERRFGKYAIHNLMLYISILLAAGLVVQIVAPEVYFQYLILDPDAVLHGQIWRLVTFLIYPPSTSIIWCALVCYIYYSIGRTLESLWGAFKFNLYVFGGILAMIIGVFICYFIWGPAAILYSVNMSNSLWLSMLLAIAVMFPDAQFLLMFIVPIKAKWIGYFYAALLVYEFITSNGPGRVMLFMSILNFLVFFLLTKNYRQTIAQAKRRRDFQRSMQQGQRAAENRQDWNARQDGGSGTGEAQQGTGYGQRPDAGYGQAGSAQDNAQGVFNRAAAGRVNRVPRHRCAVCGRTELDDPTLEFRYCSRCEGAYEYCLDHLYTHIHVTREGKEHQN